jgi:precorrin-6x reductase
MYHLVLLLEVWYFFMQGFQFLVDTSGGFAAVASDVLEEVREEYGRSCCLLFSLRPPWTVPAVPNHRASVISGLHDAVSLARLSSLANLFVPLGLQNLASSKASITNLSFTFFILGYWLNDDLAAVNSLLSS